MPRAPGNVQDRDLIPNGPGVPELDYPRAACRSLTVADRDGYPKGWEEDLAFDPDRPLTGSERSSVFFPPNGGRPERLNGAAKRICARCPIKLPCLRWALLNEVHGTWGGMTSDDRRKVSPADFQRITGVRMSGIPA